MEYLERDSVGIVPGVGPVVEAKLEKLSIRTLGDLLRWYPRAYVNTAEPVLVRDAPEGELVAVKVRVVRCTLIRTKRRGITMVEAKVSDESGDLTVRWFNQPYLVKRLEVGTEVVLVGGISRIHSRIVMNAPTIEMEVGLLPIYGQTRGVSSRNLRGFTQWASRHVKNVFDLVPGDIRHSQTLVSMDDVYTLLHLPASLLDVSKGRAAAAFQEVFTFFTRNLVSARKSREGGGLQIPADGDFLRDCVLQLPFTLTDSQKRAVWDIAKDMEDGTPMTRLLNGDVGSGKTVVAALSAALVARAGYQSVILVPTDVLARQHRESINKLLGTTGFKVVAWTAAQKDDLSAADIVVGTHAVLEKTFDLPRLGLVVIDEQHRFGVRQRQLLRKGSGQSPHILSMTATPIPRTLALALYSNLAVSQLREKPSDRLPIVTQIIPPTQAIQIHERIMTELLQEHAILILCPLIEEKPKEVTEDTVFRLFDSDEAVLAERKTVKAEVERLRAEHSEYGVIEGLHGRMKPDEKRQVLERVLRKEVQVLVATSVIEVGIDIPHATVMVVEGAEAFGLAQLHQFRGRVGRSIWQSYCYLCPAISSPNVTQRLQVLVDHQSGFEVAERDLQLRGPGDLSGLSQSGLPDFRMAVLTDVAYLAKVKAVVDEYVAAHPEFLDTAEQQIGSMISGGLK